MASSPRRPWDTALVIRETRKPYRPCRSPSDRHKGVSPQVGDRSAMEGKTAENRSDRQAECRSQRVAGYHRREAAGGIATVPGANIPGRSQRLVPAVTKNGTLAITAVRPAGLRVVRNCNCSWEKPQARCRRTPRPGPWLRWTFGNERPRVFSTLFFGGKFMSVFRYVHDGSDAAIRFVDHGLMHTSLPAEFQGKHLGKVVDGLDALTHQLDPA
jgi:hypothetical protein